MYPFIIRAYNYRKPTECNKCGYIIKPRHLHAHLYLCSCDGGLITKCLCVRCAWDYWQSNDIAIDLFSDSILNKGTNTHDRNKLKRERP